MEKQIGKIERKSRSHNGSFFFGLFIGFLLCIATIAGIGAFAYFKVSVNWVNKTFRTDVTLGNEDLDGLTLSKLVNHSVGLVNNIDSYTLNDLKSDFGIDIGSEIIGISITDLKDVPFSSLLDAIQDKFANISADELKNTLDLSGLNDILNKKNIYYFNDNKLYQDDAHTEVVTFAYTYDELENRVEVKGNYFAISTLDNSVQIELKYLPLTTALSDFMDNMGETTTLRELKSYGVTLPDFLDKEEYLDRSINELQNIIDDLYIADFLNYTISGDTVYNGSTEVKGVMAKLAKIQIKDMGNIKQTIDDMYIADILGYTYDTATGKVTNASGVEQTGVIKAIAKFKVGELDTGINTLTIADLFENRTGALSLINANTTIDNIPSALSTALSTSTLEKLYDAGLFTADNFETSKTKTVTLSSGTTKQVKDLLLDEVIEVFLEYVNSIP